MRLWSRLRVWWNATLRRSRMESEMDAELRFHMEAYAEDLIQSGVPSREALRRARLQFGGVERAKEECREARGVNLVESLIQDLRYGTGNMLRTPGFTAITVLTLALGIGATTAIFSAVNPILFEPLPYPLAQPCSVPYVSRTGGAQPFLRRDRRDEGMAADIGQCEGTRTIRWAVRERWLLPSARCAAVSGKRL